MEAVPDARGEVSVEETALYRFSDREGRARLKLAEALEKLSKALSVLAVSLELTPEESAVVVPACPALIEAAAAQRGLVEGVR